MPYISTEDIKTKRNILKKTFPDFKMSVRRNHHSTIAVSIMEAPFNMLTASHGRDYEQINHYYIEEHYKDHPEICKVLLGIKNIIVNGQRELVYDGDYGSVPTFYISINIGKWDKPFKVSGKEKKKEKPLKLLECNCCGTYTHGRQWWNRDTGYGECKSCVNWKLDEGRETKEEIEFSSGKIGVYCGID